MVGCSVELKYRTDGVSVTAGGVQEERSKLTRGSEKKIDAEREKTGRPRQGMTASRHRWHVPIVALYNTY